jgi:hypothetical protein
MNMLQFHAFLSYAKSIYCKSSITTDIPCDVFPCQLLKVKCQNPHEKLSDVAAKDA